MFPKLLTSLPGPKAKALIDRDSAVISPSYTRGYPLVAERAKDARRLSLCFARNGVVHDEGKDRRGRAWIRDRKEGGGREVQICFGAVGGVGR